MAGQGLIPWQEGASWAALRSAFRWPDPAQFNIARAVCDDWAAIDPDRLALIQPMEKGGDERYSYGALRRLSDKLAHGLLRLDLAPGGRIGVLLGQSVETLLTHLAGYKTGAIVVPLFTAFGADALEYRLRDSGTSVLVTDLANYEKIAPLRDRLPDLRHVLVIDGAPEGTRDFWALLLAGRDGFRGPVTTPATPALLVYTSGTTGPPKGALHGHQVLLGHLPGVETHQNRFPQPGDRMWTPADWAWLGGLMNALLPSLYFGVPVVAHRMGRFDAEAAFALMRDYEIRNSFLPPTALKYLRQGPPPQGLALRSIGSGGEPLGPDLLEWGRSALGLDINEFYGATECNLVLGNCASVFAPRPGSTGRAVPGAEVAVLGPDGQPLGAGETGEIAVRRGSLAMFLEYWKQPEKTAEKFAGDWLLMGDEGQMDAEGYVFFSARTDDVITSAGYRIGPAEIETCLASHPNVVMAAAIGVPDAARGAVVKAFVVTRSPPAPDLEETLIAEVRSRLSPHVAPRSISFVESLPMTATGKILRRALRDTL